MKNTANMIAAIIVVCFGTLGSANAGMYFDNTGGGWMDHGDMLHGLGSNSGRYWLKTPGALIGGGYDSGRTISIFD